MPVTRNQSEKASARSGCAPSDHGPYGIPVMRSVLPGRRCSLAASPGSITTWFAAPGSDIAPCRILTRSTDTPSMSSGLAKASSRVSGKPPAAGSPRLYWIADDIAAT